MRASCALLAKCDRRVEEERTHTAACFSALICMVCILRLKNTSNCRDKHVSRSALRDLAFGPFQDKHPEWYYNSLVIMQVELRNANTLQVCHSGAAVFNRDNNANINCLIYND